MMKPVVIIASTRVLRNISLSLIEIISNVGKTMRKGIVLRAKAKCSTETEIATKSIIHRSSNSSGRPCVESLTVWLLEVPIRRICGMIAKTRPRSAVVVMSLSRDRCINGSPMKQV
jgi:hypothetical protein